MSAIIGKAFYWPTVLLAAVIAGGTTGFEVVQMFKPTATEFIVSGDGYLPDVDAAFAKYEEAKDSGDFASALTADEMINVAYRLFSLEEETWSQGVGASIAAGFVNQGIQSMTVHSGERYFEESNSFSSIIQIYDRMFQEGDTTTTYWGGDTNYASHPKKEYPNDEYKKLMGRYVSEGLVYIVSPKTLILDADTPSGKPASGIKETPDGYVIEAELDKRYGVINYQCQMQTISDLKYKPQFQFCHITVTVDKQLNLQKMVTFEHYTAVTSQGVGSDAEGSLTTVYHHEPAPFGFPEVGGTVAPYPESL